VKEFKAIVWSDDKLPGKHITLFAETLEEARRKLLAEFGPEAKISLWNEDDENRLRASK
jgi:hypothetical protein